MKITRRGAIGILATSATSAAFEPQAAAPASAPGTTPPALETGVTWGAQSHNGDSL